MPVQACEENGKPGYKYGESGKCYTYRQGNEASRKRAQQKAYAQGAAIEARGYQENIFCATGPGGGVDPTCTKEGPDTGGGSGGITEGMRTGTQKIAARTPLEPMSIRQPGYRPRGPGDEIHYAASGSYEKAREYANARAAAARRNFGKAQQFDDVDTKQSFIGSAEHDHRLAAELHKVAAGLTQDGKQVQYHEMQVKLHEQKSAELRKQLDELWEKHLVQEREKREARKSEPEQTKSPEDLAQIRAEQVAYHTKSSAMTEARRAVRGANRWADARNPGERAYGLGKEIKKLEDAVTKLREVGAAKEATTYEAKIAEYKQKLTSNAFPPGGAAGGTARPKLDLPLLPDNLTVTEGEDDPDAVEVSRSDLLKIKAVIDRLLGDTEQSEEVDEDENLDEEEIGDEDEQEEFDDTDESQDDIKRRM